MKKAIAILSVFMVVSMSFSSVFAATQKTTFDRKTSTGDIVRDNLTNVTKGETIRGTNLSQRSGGYAEIGYADGLFSLSASFTGLPIPRGDDFYEGWLVQRDPFKFISTGKLTRSSDGIYNNKLETDIDYRSYDFYVLTLEPNDGDPAPADHVFEGEPDIREHSVLNNKFVNSLENVAKSQVIRGTITPSRATGYAEAGYNDGIFWVEANFEMLNAPKQQGDFYEGWLVQRDPFKFISTGKLEKSGIGKYRNFFKTDIDYSSYDFYVLTLEPDDGDPAPAEHVFEGDTLQVVREIDPSVALTTSQKDSFAATVEANEELVEAGPTIVRVELNDQQRGVRDVILNKVGRLSQKKIDLVLDRVFLLRETIKGLNISDAKRENYNTTLDLFEAVLLSGEVTK